MASPNQPRCRLKDWNAHVWKKHPNPVSSEVTPRTERQAPAVARPVTARVFASGFTAALQRPLPIDVQTESLHLDPPRVIQVALGRHDIQVHGYEFAAPKARPSTFEFSDPKAGKQAESPQPQDTPVQPIKTDRSAPSTQYRRMRPASDTVKLQDRLFYLLQPPLETWLSTQNFQFPFEPFPFQMDGIAFLYPRHAAILSDAMGLGKTMQAITAMRMLLRAGEVQSVLVVCPKPLVTNWVRETSVWAPEIPVAVIAGNQQRRQFQWQSRNVPVHVANYELLVRDESIIQDAGPFDLVILDEAQRIKNRKSSTSRVARSIPRDRNWALTGTPIENSAEDLIGIFDFVRPGQLHSTMTPRGMGKAASDYILRRTKECVLKDLPPKLFRDATIDLTPQQRQSYDLAQSKGVIRLNELGDSITIQHVFELVLRLKQICNFDPVTQESAKFDRLVADLEEVAQSGQKAIVFSQWVNTLDKLEQRLRRFGPLAYHGRIPHARRDAVLERFRTQNQHSVLLMSYGAGSVGLNLQFCGYVFLFDRWWNPAVEDQAINRAHRIGCAGPVTVTRFLTQDTIEERIDAVLEEKRELLQAVLSATEPDRRSGLSRQEIFGLFNLPTSDAKVA